MLTTMSQDCRQRLLEVFVIWHYSNCASTLMSSQISRANISYTTIYLPWHSGRYAGGFCQNQTSCFGSSGFMLAKTRDTLLFGRYKNRVRKGRRLGKPPCKLYAGVANKQPFCKNRLKHLKRKPAGRIHLIPMSPVACRLMQKHYRFYITRQSPAHHALWGRAGFDFSVIFSLSANNS